MITTYYSNILVGNAFGNRGGIPTTVYLALSTTTPTVGGTGFTEPSSGAGYARVAIPNDTSNFGLPSSGQVASLLSHSFPQSVTAWGTVTYVGLYDSSAVGSGNLLDFFQLIEPRVVESMTTLTIAAGDLKSTFGNCPL